MDDILQELGGTTAVPLSSTTTTDINLSTDDTNDVTPLMETAVDSRFHIKHLLDNYLFGIKLVDNDGTPFPKSLLWHHLNAAIQTTERTLDIVITPTAIEERHDFSSSDFAQWGFLNLYKKPLADVSSVELMYGDRVRMEVPKQWLQTTKLSSVIQMFPTEGATNALIIGAGGNLMGGFLTFNTAPQMWRVKYTAGFIGNIPFELYDYIYKKASINILTIWGDLVLGAGIANQSISIDGLSQSYGTTKSTVYNAASARCQAYNDELTKMLPILKAKYDGIRMSVV